MSEWLRTRDWWRVTEAVIFLLTLDALFRGQWLLAVVGLFTFVAVLGRPRRPSIGAGTRRD